MLYYTILSEHNLWYNLIMITQEIEYTKHNFNKEDYWSQEIEERLRD